MVSGPESSEQHDASDLGWTNMEADKHRAGRPKGKRKIGEQLISVLS